MPVVTQHEIPWEMNYSASSSSPFFSLSRTIYSPATNLTVVGVHHTVDKSIQQNGKVDITVVVYLRVEPIEEENSCVVVHVQEAQLSPLFPQDNEDSIPEVPDFGNVEQPQ